MLNDYVCRLDHDGWQLYDEMDGVQDIAAGLSAELTRLVREAQERLLREPQLSEHKLAESIRDTMYRIMRSAASYGACDTEPTCALVDELESALGLDPGSLER